jgi:hypothetical protein
LRALRLVLAAAVLASSSACVESLTSPSPSPCELATAGEVRALIGADLVDVPADQIGEETAPYCRWATSGRAREMKLEVWSVDELEGVLQTDAKSYYEKLWHDAGSIRQDWPGVGDSAFYWAFEDNGATAGVVQVVIRVDNRILVFDGQNLNTAATLKFAKTASTRI